MFEKLIQSMLPPGFDIQVIFEVITRLAQDAAEVKATALRIEAMLLASPSKSEAVVSAVLPALTQATTADTVSDPAPPANAQIVTSATSVAATLTPPLSPLEAQSAAAVQSALAAQPDISPEAAAVLSDAADAQAQLPVQPVGSPPTAPIWGAH